MRTLVLVLALSFSSVKAAKLDIGVLVSDNNEAKELSRTITDSLQAHTATVAFESKELPENINFLITIGEEAYLDSVKNLTSKPVVSLRVSHNTYKKHDFYSFSNNQKSAIFLEPSPLHTLDLVAGFFPIGARIALLKNGVGDDYFAPLLNYAMSKNIEIVLFDINDQVPIGKRLSSIRNFDAIMALPNNKIYNQDTMANILMTTYRMKVPLFAYSLKNVKQGALATIHSSKEDITRQLNENITHFVNTGVLQQASFPKYGKVKINKTVADSLDLIYTGAVNKKVGKSDE